jgi:hypothetical protein
MTQSFLSRLLSAFLKRSEKRIGPAGEEDFHWGPDPQEHEVRGFSSFLVTPDEFPIGKSC